MCVRRTRLDDALISCLISYYQDYSQYMRSCTTSLSKVSPIHKGGKKEEDGIDIFNPQDDTKTPMLNGTTVQGIKETK